MNVPLMVTSAGSDCQSGARSKHLAHVVQSGRPLPLPPLVLIAVHEIAAASSAAYDACKGSRERSVGVPNHEKQGQIKPTQSVIGWRGASASRWVRRCRLLMQWPGHLS